MPREFTLQLDPENYEQWAYVTSVPQRILIRIQTRGPGEGEQITSSTLVITPEEALDIARTIHEEAASTVAGRELDNATD